MSLKLEIVTPTGKVLDADQVKALGGSWGRYKDVDGSILISPI